MAVKTVLIVEDDVYISDMLSEHLSREGYRTLKAFSGTEAVMLLSSQRPDLILLDLMLPGLSGEEVLPKTRGIPVIIISAKADIPDKVKLLMSGADDYVTKPFDMSELLARIAVQLRRTGPERSGILTFDGIELNTETHEVSLSGQPVRLTRTEYAILKCLMTNPSQVVTKSRILELISPDTPDCTESTLKVHVSNLRIKLREKSGKDHIEAVWGIGFKMREV